MLTYCLKCKKKIQKEKSKKNRDAKKNDKN